MEIEDVKIKIDYDRQVSMFGEERAYTALQFYMLGASEMETQLFVEQRQNEMLIKECEDLKKENELQQENLMHNEAELIPLREKFQRLQDNILVYQKQSEADWFEIGERDKKIEELKEAVNWALKNCKPERDELHSDFFNILTNAVNTTEIDEQIKHVRNKNGYR
jgi:hypothetical protein